MARALALVVASLYLSGCMTVALAIKDKDTPPTHAVVGGVFADVSVAAGGSLVQGHFGDADDEPHPYLWAWIGGVLLVDAIAAVMLHRHQQAAAAAAAD